MIVIVVVGRHAHGLHPDGLGACDIAVDQIAEMHGLLRLHTQAVECHLKDLTVRLADTDFIGKAQARKAIAQTVTP